MPSPFPGMDPYLEDPGSWRDVHLNLIASIQDVLGRRIRPRYVVRVEDRVYISDEGDPGRDVILPDLSVADASREVPAVGGGAAVEVAEPMMLTTLLDEEIHEARLRVIDRESREVVTVIEVLSPTNKLPGSRGRRDYIQKRKRIIASTTNLVEIDLLRSGHPYVPRELLRPCEYTVHISKPQERPVGRVWPIRLSHRLPVVGVPLRAGDADAPLDLQEVLDSTYERAGYGFSLDYTQPPRPRLKRPWDAWADSLLREKGHR